MKEKSSSIPPGRRPSGSSRSNTGKPAFSGRKRISADAGNSERERKPFDPDRKSRPAFRSEKPTEGARPLRGKPGETDNRRPFKAKGTWEKSDDRSERPRSSKPPREGDWKRPENRRTESGNSGDRERKPGRPGGFSKPSGPRSFGGKKPFAGGKFQDRPKTTTSGEGEERKPFRPRREEDADKPRKPRSFGQQAAANRKSFGRNRDGQTPEYDWKRIQSSAPRSNFRKKTEAPAKDSDLIRLNRYISMSGLCSRREADELISTGQITVNGKMVDQLGYQVKKTDVVKYGKRLLNKEKLVYLLLNKPKDFITTTDDPKERKTVMHLIESACEERLYPVGRLDRNTTGLLLFTNDGELSERLMHPSHGVRKIYQVDLDKPLTAADEAKIREGLELEDGKAEVDELEVLSKDRDILGMSIHIGRNRIVRRIFEHLGYEVIRLDRVMYAGLTKKDLPRGNWRFLTEKEVINLKYFS